MSRFVVDLREDERKAIIRLAEKERRRISEQIAVIVRAWLRRIGMIENDRKWDEDIATSRVQQDLD